MQNTSRTGAKRYVPPVAAKVGRVATDTFGTIHTQKDATTWGFKKG
ncbi:hypothetical protein [Nocardia panacis]|nr:hypothetical protein [Nocardia panacis]